MVGDSEAAIEAARRSGLEVRVVSHGPVDSLAEAAALAGVEPHDLQKSMVVRLGEGDYILVLVPGDCVIDWKKLRHLLGVSRLTMAPQEEAEEVTGFKRGTITPFGTKTSLRVVADESIRGHHIALGAGAYYTHILVDADALIEHFDALVGDIAKPQ